MSEKIVPVEAGILEVWTVALIHIAAQIKEVVTGKHATDVDALHEVLADIYAHVDPITDELHDIVGRMSDEQVKRAATGCIKMLQGFKRKLDAAKKAADTISTKPRSEGGRKTH